MKKTKVLFIYPNCMLSTLLPLSVAQLSACLKHNGIDVQLFDTTYYQTEEQSFEEKKVELLQLKPFDLGTPPMPEHQMYRDLQDMVDWYAPDIVAMTVVEDTLDLGLKLLESIKDYNKRVPRIVGGVAANWWHEKLFASGLVDYVCSGEGEDAFVEFVNCYSASMSKLPENISMADFRSSMRAPTDLDSLPFIDYDVFADNRLARPMHGTVRRMIHVEADRGCPFTCLAGNTLINTIYGPVEIKKLVGKRTKVLTYDKTSDEILFVDAFNIRKTRENVDLVRVNFDGGSYIDCTPDHLFKRFINGNQFVSVREYDTEAKDLKFGDSVRAILGSNNRKVTMVEKLEVKEDVFCMEVPGFNWFYANNVLVHNCTYCEAPSLRKMYWNAGKYKYYRRKSVDRLLAEMLFLKKKYKPDYIDICAESFLAKPEEEVWAFCKRYKKEIGLPFWCQSRTETITRGKLEALKYAGATDMQFGIEHGNEEFRKKWLHRKGSNKQMLAALKLVEEVGIPYTVNNIIGFPNDNRITIFDTVDFNRQITPKTMNCYIFVPYKGTWLYNYCMESGLLEEDNKSQTLLGGSTKLIHKYVTKEELLGIQRCFSLYARFSDDWSQIILRAEKFDELGNELYKMLAERFRRLYYL